MNGFINLSRETSKNLDSVVFKNSKNLCRDALLLAANHSYSTASSLLILSLEECIKAHYILLYAKGIDVYKTKLAKKIFTSHVERHDVAKSLELVLGIFEVIDNLFSPVEKFNNSNSRGLLYITRLINSFIVIKQTHNRIRSIGNFNRMKNNGFYVDYVEKVIIPRAVVRK
jgi:AbiV family abortive infection protein